MAHFEGFDLFELIGRSVLIRNLFLSHFVAKAANKAVGIMKGGAENYSI
jgi:hypothetical protein